MSRTVDAAGRLVIQPLAVTLVRRGRLLVAKPQAKVPRLRQATIERTRRRVRASR